MQLLKLLMEKELELAVKFDIIHKSGAWFEYNGEKIGQGKEKAKDFLLNNPSEAQQIKEAVVNAIKESK